VVTENRHGLLVSVRVKQPYGQAEREAALAMAKGPRTAGSCRERGHAALQFGAWLDEQAGGAVRWMVGRCGTKGSDLSQQAKEPMEEFAFRGHRRGTGWKRATGATDPPLDDTFGPAVSGLRRSRNRVLLSDHLHGELKIASPERRPCWIPIRTRQATQATGRHRRNGNRARWAKFATEFPVDYR